MRTACLFCQRLKASLFPTRCWKLCQELWWGGRRVTWLLGISHVQQSHLSTKEERLTFTTPRVSINVLSTTRATSQTLGFPTDFLHYENMAGAIFLWEAINHQMSECLSSQGLSPLQPAGDKIQNATVQQAWHVPAGWALAASPRWHHSQPLNSSPRRDLTRLYRSQPAASKVQQPPSRSWAPRRLCQLPLGPSQYICPVLATSPLCLFTAQEFSHQAWDYGRDQPRFPFSLPRNTRSSKPKPFPRPALTRLPPSAPDTS